MFFEALPAFFAALPLTFGGMFEIDGGQNRTVPDPAVIRHIYTPWKAGNDASSLRLYDSSSDADNK